jgi:ATP/maltotriose-dependent transcriptional regulator MalT
MKVYCSDVELEQLETALAAASGQERLGLLVAQSWAIRQRDSKRALSLADEVEQALPRDAKDAASQKMRARLALVRAEVAALFGHFDQAEAELERAHVLIQSSPDAILAGDRFLVTATLCVESGQAEREFSSYQEATEAFATSGDIERLAIAEAWSVSRVSIDFHF